MAPSSSQDKAAGTSTAWRSYTKEEKHQMLRAQTLLVHCGFGNSVATPKNIQEWLDFKKALMVEQKENLEEQVERIELRLLPYQDVVPWLTSDILHSESNARLKFIEEVIAEAKKTERKWDGEPVAVMETFAGVEWEYRGLGGVLAEATVWADDRKERYEMKEKNELALARVKGKGKATDDEDQEFADDNHIPWPTIAEWKQDGNTRHEIGLPRQLPVPRYNRINPRIRVYMEQLGIDVDTIEYLPTGFRETFQFSDFDHVIPLMPWTMPSSEPECPVNEESLAEIGVWEELLEKLNGRPASEE